MRRKITRVRGSVDGKKGAMWGARKYSEFTSLEDEKEGGNERENGGNERGGV